MGLFDIIGPVMIGPSSSHTAGAARLGRLVRKLAGQEIQEATLYLHGSFAATYRGHGTDKALIAGLLDLPPWDERLRGSFELAKKAGLRYRFVPTDLGEDAHPNTVRFDILCKDGSRHTVTGASVGGGQVEISEIDALRVRFTGERPIIVCRHHDHPGVIAAIAGLLYEARINIGNMQVDRSRETHLAQMYLEIDSFPPPGLEKEIKAIPGIQDAMILRPLEEEQVQ